MSKKLLLNKERMISLIIGLILIAILAGFYFHRPGDEEFSREARGVVLETDDRDVQGSGITRFGNQFVEVELKDGKFQGQQIRATNQLVGSLAWDYSFSEGEEIIVGLFETAEGQIAGAIALDVYRQNWTFILMAFFMLLLLLYAGYTGLRALISFAGSVYIIWNLLIPGLLDGLNPLYFSGFVLVILSALIVFSIAGFTKKGISAFVGTVSSLFITIGVVVFFGNRLALDGLSVPYVGEVLFAGYMHLNIRDIFFATVVIGASGAAMDIAMDMAATIKEIKLRKPDISFFELAKSGFNVGSAVIGTMTTTLLLAYIGSYMTLFMAFMTREASFVRIMNLRLIVSEILRILTGSIGIVLVAPITTIFAAWIYSIETDFSLFGIKDYFFSKKED
ncbi:YibE/F family protein [Halanaerobium hydrogeniformans]|uniref:YibE/F family protein n=1 Tax=Halanaerobium hydrogeniformans TaxID=656519 RepID=E4RLJ4_HALHG|nr:YibE/F family protein [Halanaerobium hydrogeniformans]ADQ14908.1 YibE/F family protein [Halanaerobium hydrogeniformans]